MRISQEALKALEEVLTIFDQEEKNALIKSLVPKAKQIPMREPLQKLHKEFDGLPADSLKRLWEEAEKALSLRMEGDLYSYDIEEQPILDKKELEELLSANLKGAHEIYHLRNDPKLYLIRSGQKTTKSTEKLLLNSRKLTNRAFLYPEYGLAIVKGNNTFQKKIKEFGSKSLAENFGPKSIKALDIKNYARKTEGITFLEIATPHEISGFDGVDKMQFYGKDIAKGLYGLQKRHDIRINFANVGPWVGISDGVLHLKVGKTVTLHNYSNLAKIQLLIEQ
ncbi:MAG: hypothetical protein KAR35_04170 [Candidatus Heimdallarchaeota archaeon]|nr:hypothetical protein [Candidatus Heimdallarchaeota archaeon]MCK5048550.1 hypothetical protein [Candidatus Heimdallarchaeota archaeon]